MYSFQRKCAARQRIVSPKLAGCTALGRETAKSRTMHTACHDIITRSGTPLCAQAPAAAPIPVFFVDRGRQVQASLGLPPQAAASLQRALPRIAGNEQNRG